MSEAALLLEAPETAEALLARVAARLRDTLTTLLGCDALPVRLAMASINDGRRPAIRALIARSLWLDDRAIDLGAALELMDMALRRMHGRLQADDAGQGAGLTLGTAASVLVGDYWTTGAFKLLVGLGDLRVLEIVSRGAVRASETEVLGLRPAASVDADDLLRQRLAPLAEAVAEAAIVMAGRPLATVPAARRFAQQLAWADALLARPGRDRSSTAVASALDGCRAALAELSASGDFPACHAVYQWMLNRR